MTQSNDSIDANFSVSWTHRLRFTEHPFSSDSPLNQEISKLNPLTLLPVIDRGIVNENPSFVESLQQWLDSLQIPTSELLIANGGEGAKNDSQVVDTVLESINSNNLCRKSCVLVIGGGAVLDAVSYATSIAHRGIPIIRMPSTTLSQCDSGVGVKNAVNYFGKKNFLGVFDPPYAVINDLGLLESLDNRHWISGLSEAVKVALIKDEKFFDEIESCAQELVNRDSAAMASVVKKSAILHLEHITKGGDPFERLDARPLDFGHWSAHKLEQITNHTLTHGEAVSIGLAIDLTCSVRLGLLKESVATRAIALLQALGLPTAHAELVNDALLDGIEEFRQHLGGQLTLLMLKGIADPIDIHELDTAIVRQAIAELL